MLSTVIKGDPIALFSIATTPRCRRGRYFFSGIAPLTHDPYFILLSVKQGGMKYHFLIIWVNTQPPCLKKVNFK